MKRTYAYYVLPVFLALGLSVIFAQAAPKNSGKASDFLEITYDFPAPQIVESGDYHIVRMEGLARFGKPGLPVLPCKTARILLPFDTEVTRIEVTTGKKITLPGSYVIEPGQQPVPIGFDGPAEFTLPAEEVYQSSRPFPEKRHGDSSVECKQGYRFAMMNLHPVEYLPLDGTISYYPQITVRVHTTAISGRTQPHGQLSSSGGTAAGKKGYLRPRGRLSTAERMTIKELVDNPGLMNSYSSAEEPSAGEPIAGESSSAPLEEGASTLLSPGNYEYVIITNETLLNAGGAYTFQDLVDHKIARGISATIVTTEWIYASYDGTRPSGGSDNQTRIRNFITDAYNTWGTKYVLLGGDGDAANVGGESGDNIIPSRGFSVAIVSDPDDDIPSDMYYACLDGSFDYDGDGLYGEPTDGPGGGEVDLFAEVYVGRAPVDTADEVSNFVRKTISYENSDPQDPHLRKAIMVGENLGWTPWGCDYKDEVRDGSCNYGYCTVGFPEDWTIMNLCDRDATWDKTALILELNNGPHLVNHLGHASVNYNMKMYNADVDSLTNDKHFFVYSQGCYSGSFDNRTTSGSYTDYDCIAEHFVTEANGAFAVIMNSRYGWGDRYTTNGPSQHFDREFFDAYFDEDMKSLGMINQDSKEDSAGYVSADLYGRWCCYQTNLFGDPQTPMGGAGVGPAGIIELDRQAYAPGGDINIVVKDGHLNTDPAAVEQYDNTITITTSHWDEEDQVTLTETGTDSGIFTGTITTTDDSVVPGDGILQITCAEADTITATYFDADDGTGNPATPTDTAESDCLAPEISNLRVTYSDLTTATITWETDEPAHSCVYYGATPALGASKCSSGEVTSHSMTLYGLDPGTTYYFYVTSTDVADNETVSDNGGTYYTCKGVTEVVFEDHMESGSNGWAGTGFWHLVSDTSPCPESYSPTHSWWYGQDATCDYANGRENSGSLISPRIELTGEAPVIDFMSWEETDGLFPLLDKMRLFISTDEGMSWMQLHHCQNNQAAWYPAGPIDLTPYTGTHIYLKYDFDTVSNALNDFRGWYVDDVVITNVTDCGDARLRLDRNKYDCQATVGINVADCHLDMDHTAADTATVEVTSSSESGPEIVTLTETGQNTGEFEGSIQIGPGTPASDGKLQVADGDDISVSYEDAFPTETKIVAAMVDCSPPLIAMVEANNVIHKSATVSWDTDEASDSLVYYGTTLPLDMSKWTPYMVTDHVVELTNLLPDSTYYFAVVSMDEAGNQTVDDNNDSYYSFATLPCVVDLTVASPSEEFACHQGTQTQIMAYVERCEEPSTGATVTVEFDNEEPSVTLHDDGVAPDLMANDGWYGSYWTPQETGRVTLTITASFPGYAPVSEQISGAVAYLVVDFSAEHTYGPPPFTVQFVDLSQGDPEVQNWLWEFGDGEFGTVQNPSHIYADEGYYHVSLTVSYQGVQATKTKSDFIHVLLDVPPGLDAITPNQGWNGGPTPVTISGYYLLDTPYVSIYGGNPEIKGSCVLTDPHGVYALGDYAYVADYDSGLRVVDVTDQENPVLAGTCDTPGQANDVFVMGDYAYVADGGGGLQVIDVSDPSDPFIVGSTFTGNAYGVYVVGDRAYVADNTSGLRIIDISDPSNPASVGGYQTPGDPFGVYVRGDYAYVADGTSGLQVIDVSGTYPERVGWYNTPGSARGVFVSGDHAFVADNNWGLQIINISNPASPSITGAFTTPGAAKGIHVSDDYAYIADGTSGLQVIDVIDPANPSLIGSWDTDTKALGVYISDNYAYVADGFKDGETTQGLQVINVRNHGNPSIIGNCETPGSQNNGVANGVHVSGNYAYVADGNAGLQVLDISDPSNPSVVGERGTPYYAYNVCVAGDYAHIAAGESGFIVMDISTPTDPLTVGGCGTPGDARDVHVLGNHAYVADGTSGLQVIDMSDPTSTPIVGTYNTPGVACGVYAQGNCVYVADNDFGLQVIDVIDPTAPFLAGACDIPGYARSVYVRGNYAYVAAASLNYDPPGLHIINVTDPTNPYMEGSCATPDYETCHRVYVSGNYAYLACNNAGLQVIDVTDPENPILGGSCSTPSRAYGVYVTEDYVYVADWSGLRVIQRFVPCEDVSWVSDTEITATVPAGFLPGTYHLHVTNPNNATTILPNAFTVNRMGGAPPVVSDIPDQTIAEGDSFATINLDDYVSDSDNTDQEMSWTYSGNVELSVSILDRVATITLPNENWSGSETITFTAEDPDLLSDSDGASFTVTAVNDAPVVSDIPGQTIVEGESFTSINLNDYVSDADNADAEIAWSYSGNTDLIVSIADGVATVSVPNGDWNGSETITFTAQDPGLLSDSDDASFTVTAVNDAPVVSDIPDQTIAEGDSFATINLDDYVLDVDNVDTEMAWSYSGNTDLVVSIADRVATVSVPNGDWNGSETITFTAQDPGLLSDSDGASFTVTAVNDAPVVSDIPSQTVMEGESFVAINLDDYVSDADNADADISWTYSGNTDLVVSIADRVATIAAPSGDWNGSETITFTATDPGLLSHSNDATFTVTPLPNVPPVADAGENRVVYDAVTLDASGSYDPDGTIVSYSWDIQHRDNPAYNTTATGATPVVSNLEHGFYFVTLTVTDNEGATATDEMLLGANHNCRP